MIVFGRASFGTVEAARGYRFETRFWCFQFLPFVAIESVFVWHDQAYGERRVSLIDNHPTSTILGYVRAWGAVLAAVVAYQLYASGWGPLRWLAIASVIAAYVVLLRHRRRLPQAEIAKRAVMSWFIGAPIEAKWLTFARREALVAQLNAYLEASPEQPLGDYRALPHAAVENAPLAARMTLAEVRASMLATDERTALEREASDAWSTLLERWPSLIEEQPQYWAFSSGGPGLVEGLPSTPLIDAPQPPKIAKPRKKKTRPDATPAS